MIALSTGLIAAGLMALSACSSSDGKDEATDKPSTVSKSSTAPATSDPKEAAQKEAIAAYEAYWREMEKLYADSSGKGARLDRYAASAALKKAETDAKRARDGGLIYVGHVTVTDPTVTKVDVSGKIPNATISNCLDISRWRTVDAKSKKPVKLPANRLTKYVVVSTVEKYPAGWRVTSDDPQGKSC
ncbi:hypothetical protein OG788_46325 [Streptomyces sp. NBC_00647]|uniref:hypothetical protein n=1 Tax=Streptomyces sp. NBC_00647 TaxID=2975796 RepID=UPI00324F7CC3